MSGGDAPLQERITAFWIATAQGYDNHPGNIPRSGSPLHEAWVQALREALPEPPADVLDLGTGTGYLAIIAGMLGYRVTAIDAAESMLAVARRKALEASVLARFIVGDAVAPPFGRGFDVIACRHLLWTLRDPEVAFREWRRLLRPDGRVVAFHSPWQFQDDRDASDGATGVFEQHYTREVRASLPGMSGEVDWPRLLAEAGFAPVESRRQPSLRDSSDPDAPEPFCLIARRGPVWPHTA